MKLVLIRNCETIWSEENRFMGWTDIPLSENGNANAHRLGKTLKSLKIDIGIAYTSSLARAKQTLECIKEELNCNIKTRESYKLNARHYGKLEGMDKDKARENFGDEQIAKWRRGFTEKAPEIDITDNRFPGNDPKYADILKFELPLSESQKDVYDRVVDYFEREISTFLKVGENVLLVANGSPLRVLIKYLEEIPDDEMSTIDAPAGTIIVYELDDNLKVQNKKIFN